MLKSYDELRKVDVVPFCDERDGALYLPYNKFLFVWLFFFPSH